MSCLCHSTNNKLLLLNDAHTELIEACMNGGEPASLLEKQDYEDIGQCMPPDPNSSYSIRLIFHQNRANFNCNDTYPYYGRLSINDSRTCVNGQPLYLPPFPSTEITRCHAATIIPGTSDNIFNLTDWRPCAEEQRFICRLEANTTDNTFPSCGLIPTASSFAKTTTAKTVFRNSSANTEEAALTNSTATIVGSVIGIFVVFLILILIYCFYKRNQAKQSTPKNKTQEDIYSKLVVN